MNKISKTRNIMINNLTYSKLKKQFILFKKAQGLAERTMKDYDKTFEVFERYYTKEIIDIEEMQDALLEMFSKWSTSAPATYNVPFSNLQFFFNWAVDSEYLEKNPLSKTQNTIDNYIRNIQNFKKWYKDTTNDELKKLYRPNVLDYKSYLRNIKKTKSGQPLKAETINANLSAIMKYNEFLVEQGIQKDIVLSDRDFIKIQKQRINPCTVDKLDVEEFRQLILKNESKRDYAIITLLAYAGLRISECLNIKLNDFDLDIKELIIRDGKGGKQRVVYLNDKIVTAIKEYLKERNSKSEYLFCSRQSDKVCRSRINQIFDKYSKVMHPHLLRHFAFTNMADNGLSIVEIAMIGGHSSTRTTEIYINPSQKKIKEKLNCL